MEVYLDSGKLAGRITLNVKDEGAYKIPINILSQLPAGKGNIAIKRIWLGEFQPDKNKKDMIGVKTVVSAVGNIKVLDI